jgi:serine carboxypeptidase-like clade 2
MHVLLNDSSDTISNNWGDSPKSMLHIYKELIAAGLRIWVFRSVL